MAGQADREAETAERPADGEVEVVEPVPGHGDADGQRAPSATATAWVSAPTGEASSGWSRVSTTSTAAVTSSTATWRRTSPSGAPPADDERGQPGEAGRHEQ